MESGQEKRKAEMSDTPRTDAFYWKEIAAAMTPRTASEWSDFASDLERENDELLRRLARLSVWRERMAAVVSPYLREDDGSDLIPDHVRVSNMLERMGGIE
jgi:hypothetical protein